MKKLIFILFLILSLNSFGQFYGSNQNYPTKYTCTVDLSLATYNSVNFDVSVQISNPTSIKFKRITGEIIYIIDNTVDSVFQYDLTTGWDITTASYNNKSFYLGNQDSSPTGIAISSNGAYMFMLGSGSDSVYQYSLSVNGNITTATYDNISFYVGSQDIAPIDIYLKNDGTSFYITGNLNNRIFQYNLISGDLSTASYSGNSVEASGGTNPAGLTFNDNGSQMYVCNNITSITNQYSFTIPWDLSTASLDFKILDSTTEESLLRTTYFKGDCGSIYILGATNNTIYEYDF